MTFQMENQNWLKKLKFFKKNWSSIWFKTTSAYHDVCQTKVKTDDIKWIQYKLLEEELILKKINFKLLPEMTSMIAAAALEYCFLYTKSYRSRAEVLLWIWCNFWTPRIDKSDLASDCQRLQSNFYYLWCQKDSVHFSLVSKNLISKCHHHRKWHKVDRPKILWTLMLNYFKSLEEN